MTLRPKLICSTVVAAALVITGAAIRAEGPGFVLPVAGDPPGGSVTRYYSLTLHVRPLLFWMTRDDVGGARISWSPQQGPDRWVEFLVGSDPERAPMAINRWGFVSEHTRDDTTELTGVMTETDDRWIDAARDSAATAAANGRTFWVFRATVCNGEATTSIGRLTSDTDITYRQYAALLSRPPAGAPQRSRLAPGVEPGFLGALKEIVHSSVETWQNQHRLVPGGLLRRNYMYAGRIYDLSLQAASVTTLPVGSALPSRRAIDGAFQIRNVADGSVTDFRMVYAVDGPDAETPLRVVYRPRWWVELELGIVAHP